MNKWKTYKLGEIVDVLGDGIHGTPIYNEVGDYYFINGNNLGEGYIKIKENTLKVDEKEYLKHKKNLTNRTLLLSINGTLGNVAKYRGEPCILGKSACFLNISESCERDFIYYIMISPLFRRDLENMATGTTIKNVSLKALRNYEISLPPLAEQKRIADILSAIDDKIELNRRINANLEQQAQALYKSWFVNFEPFGGKMPEDWREGTLGEIMTITSGKHPKNRVSIKTKDVNIPIVGAADIIGYTNEMLYSTPILIIGRVGTHGIVQRFSTKCWPSDNTLVIQTKYYEMCYQLLKQIDYKKLNRGSTQPLITQTDIKGVEVIIPPIEILEEYENRVSILFHSINNYDIENSTLSALRDTLLPKLMSGEITL